MGSKAGYLYSLFWIILKVEISFSIVPDPCPDIRPSTQATDMCLSGSAIEQTGDAYEGNDNFDHIALRARTQADNCICLVFVENQSLSSIQMYIEPYMKLSNSTPSEHVCGLELHLDFYYMETTQPTLLPIKCTSGKNPRAFPFYKHSVLKFTSKVVDGNFTRGYCIDLKRAHEPGQNATLKIVCDVPGVTPSLNLITTQSQSDIIGPVTSTKSSINDHQASPGSSTNDTGNPTVYIVAGASAGVLLVVTIAGMILFCKRRSSRKNKETQETRKEETTSANEQDDTNYDGLKYNMLYVSAEHQDALEGDYHTVNNEEPRIISKASKHDMNYSTIEDNAALTPSKTIPYQGIALNSNKGPGYENFNGTENTKVKHLIPSAENSNVYAVVDKKKRVMLNNKNGTVNPSQTYAVVDKTRKN